MTSLPSGARMPGRWEWICGCLCTYSQSSPAGSAPGAHSRNLLSGFLSFSVWLLHSLLVFLGSILSDSCHRQSQLREVPRKEVPSSTHSKWKFGINRSPTSGIQCLIIWGEAGAITRNKVHNKCIALESSGNHLLTGPRKSCLPWNWSLVLKRLGKAVLDYSKRTQEGRECLGTICNP